jgi:hypothetical protein
MFTIHFSSTNITPAMKIEYTKIVQIGYNTKQAALFSAQPSQMTSFFLYAAPPHFLEQ